MKPDDTELARALAALDRPMDYVLTVSAAQTAARLLRELAADFANYALHVGHAIPCAREMDREKACDCGLDAARAKWRLPS